MTDTLASQRRKIGGAGDLESVVRSMKALAASSICQYEKSVLSLQDYYHNIELGLIVCLRNRERVRVDNREEPEFASVLTKTVNVVVFGSDQGLVGQFNEQIAEFVVKSIERMPGEKKIWAVGERVHSRLTEAGYAPVGLFAVPTSVNAITPLVGRILIESEAHYGQGEIGQLYLYRNRPVSGATYEPLGQQLLPLDHTSGTRLAHQPWPTKFQPEVLGDTEPTLRALVGEYLFVSLYKACAESLASENASRLAAMQRAEKNIDELMEALNQTFRQMRQSSIDEELFEVLSGYESLSKSETNRNSDKKNGEEMSIMVSDEP